MSKVAVYPELVVTRSKGTYKSITIGGKERFLGTLVHGANSRSFLSPLCQQDIEFLGHGGRARIIVVEPEGDIEKSLTTTCELLGVSVTRIDATNANSSAGFNPLLGWNIEVSERMVKIVTRAGEEPFMDHAKASIFRNIVLLLKLVFEENMHIDHLYQVLQTPRLLFRYMKEVRAKIDEHQWDEDQEYIAKNVLKSLEKHILLGEWRESFSHICVGLCMEVSHLISTEPMKQVLTDAEAISLPEILEQPGVLFVRTGSTHIGDFFGQVFLQTLQDAVRSRPDDEDRQPVITYISDFNRYVTDTYSESFLRSRVYQQAQIVAIDSIHMALVKSRELILSNCRNQIVLSGMNALDAEEVSKRMPIHVSDLMENPSDEVYVKRASSNKIECGIR